MCFYPVQSVSGVCWVENSKKMLIAPPLGPFLVLFLPILCAAPDFIISQDVLDNIKKKKLICPLE